MANKQQKIRVGFVVSDKMQKTRVVKVEQIKRHALYEKTMRLTKKYKVHDENNQSKIGDRVEIEPSRPISKEKKWILRRVLA
jgi:small subunit ribosomal protein S17